MERLGLIAGSGQLPIVLANILKGQGKSILAVALREETSRDIEAHVDQCFWIGVGEFGALLDILKREGIQRAIMIGGINKRRIFGGTGPDEKGMMLLTSLKNRGDNEILAAVASELEKEGVIIEGSNPYFESILAPSGPLTSGRPDERQRNDIDLGLNVIRCIGSLDIGQSVVVKDGVVLAVEAIEGTDEAIRRGGKLGGPGVVVVKASKPTQDLRFDCPVVGLRTVEVMAQVEAAVLAIEANKTLMADKDKAVREAERTGIAIFAY
jgi:DUF1009 family protein